MMTLWLVRVREGETVDLWGLEGRTRGLSYWKVRIPTRTDPTRVRLTGEDDQRSRLRTHVGGWREGSGLCHLRRRRYSPPARRTYLSTTTSIVGMGPLTTRVL